MMTIDEAIIHAENVALNSENGLYDAIALGGQNPSQEEIDECMKCAEEHRQLAEWLKELKQYQWIPVSERLPKAEDMYQPPEQRYLCQLEAYGERKFCVLSRLKGAVSPFWDWYGVAVHDSEVTAWMPLPTPYKGGDSDG